MKIAFGREKYAIGARGKRHTAEAQVAAEKAAAAHATQSEYVKIRSPRFRLRPQNKMAANASKGRSIGCGFAGEQIPPQHPICEESLGQ